MMLFKYLLNDSGGMVFGLKYDTAQRTLTIGTTGGSKETLPLIINNYFSGIGSIAFVSSSRSRKAYKTTIHQTDFFKGIIALQKSSISIVETKSFGRIFR